MIKSKEKKGSQSKALLPIHIFHHFINCTRHLLLTMCIAKLLLHSLSFYFSYLTLNEIRMHFGKEKGHTVMMLKKINLKYYEFN